MEIQALKINADDKLQVASILLTHSEMQKQRVTTSRDLLSRMKNEEPEEEDMIEILEEQTRVFEEDGQNLNRLATLFLD